MTVDNSDFTIARTYPHARSLVFSAFADEDKKRLWFGAAKIFADKQWTHDFKVRGRDHMSATDEGGVRHSYDAEYHNIVPDERIVFSYTMELDGVPLSATLASVTFEDVEGGCLVTLTEHGAYYDEAGATEPRKDGQAANFDALGRALDQLAS